MGCGLRLPFGLGNFGAPGLAFNNYGGFNGGSPFSGFGRGGFGGLNPYQGGFGRNGFFGGNPATDFMFNKQKEGFDLATGNLPGYLGDKFNEARDVSLMNPRTNRGFGGFPGGCNQCC